MAPADPARQSVKDAARLYISKGWQVVPLAPGAKAPTDEGWLRLVFKPDDFDDNDNIGLRSVGGLVDIDCDAPEVIACAAAFLLKTGAVYGRPSKPNAHWLYYAAIDKLIAYKDLGATTDKATLIEIRVNHQSMCPPSKHPDGEELGWANILGEADVVDRDELHRAVRLAATCALISRYYNPPGQRHDWGVALSGTLRGLGVREEECVRLFTWAAKWARDEKVNDRLGAVKTTYSRSEDDALQGDKALVDVISSPGRDAGKTFLRSLHKIWGSSSSAFITDHTGEKILNHQENIRRALIKLDANLAYDRFSEIMWLRWGAYEGALDEKWLNRLWLTIENQYHFRPAIDYFSRTIANLASLNEFHPVQDWLNSLRWDGVARLDAWLIDGAQAADNEYVRAVSSLVMIAAVRRVFEHGCKFDELLVLEGHQGHNKSTALEALCPRRDWFSDDLPLNVEAKQIIERTLGKWIIEAADLSGFHRSQVEQLKSMLSRQVDGPVRMAYARMSTSRPRQFIIIGTTNSHTYLKDATGNRRFWPVRIDTFDIGWIRKNRDQLWAEALARHVAHEDIRLDPRLYGMAAMQQERRRIEDAWEIAFYDRFDRDKEHRIPPEDLWETLGIPLAQRDERSTERLNGVMQRLGFRKMSVRNKLKKVVKGWGRDIVEGQASLKEEV